MDRIIEKKRGLQKKHIPYIAAGIFALIVILWIIWGNHQSTMRVEKKDLTISTVTQGEFKDYVRLNGTVIPIQVVHISSEEGGIVVEKVAEEGQSVKKGDVIIRLSNNDLDLQILNSEAELAEKQNLLRNTQVTMQQNKLSNETEQASLNMDVERKHRAYEQNKRLYKEKLFQKNNSYKAKKTTNLPKRNKSLLANDSKKMHNTAAYRWNRWRIIWQTCTAMW